MKKLNGRKMLLFYFLKKKHTKFQQLRRRGAIAKIIRTNLWKEASIILQNDGYKYYPKQCSVKWKKYDKELQGNTVLKLIKIPL